MKRILITLTLVLCVFEGATAQRKKLVPNCMQAPFDARKSFPKLEYECLEGVNDFDEKIVEPGDDFAVERPFHGRVLQQPGAGGHVIALVGNCPDEFG